MDTQTLKRTAHGVQDIELYLDVAAYFSAPLGDPYDFFFKLITIVKETFGDHKASMWIGSRGLPTLPLEQDWTGRRERDALSAILAADPARLPPADEIDVITADDRRRWCITYSRSERIDGIPADPILNFKLDGKVLVGQRRINALTLLITTFNVIDETRLCYFGLVDVNPDYLGGAELYGSNPARPLNWRSEAGHIDWLMLGDRRRRLVRDVYWGMYLSGEHMQRLPSDFCDRFLAVETENERPQSVARLDSGSVFLAMSDDPLDAPFPFPTGAHCPALRNAVWVRQQLREAGML